MLRFALLTFFSVSPFMAASVVLAPATVNAQEPPAPSPPPPPRDCESRHPPVTS